MESEPENRNRKLEEKDRHFKEVLLPRLTPILATLAIIVSLFTAIKGSMGVAELYGRFKDNLSSIIIGSNILVSLLAVILLGRQRDVRLVIKDKKKFQSLAELGDDVDIKKYTNNLNNRVEKLVSQFKLHVVLFAISLVLIYLIIALTIYTKNEARQITFFTVATNLINLIGALFVHCAFIVLYNKTLIAQTPSGKTAEDANDQLKLETSEKLNYYANQYWVMPLLTVVVYTLLFVALSVANSRILKPEEQVVFLNIADLFAGSYNGLAMSLLFGRYVSIEQSVRNTSWYNNLLENIFRPFSNVSYKSVVTVGIVFILPIYALAQPLFGNLQLTEFGNARDFQTWVFGICLVGKICFFHLTYLLISNRILHLYIYGLASNIGNFRELELCFDDPKTEAETPPSDGKTPITDQDETPQTETELP